ncbi:MAG: hypothetical protein ACYDHT_08435 [Solirubrobacteraceae bacterium]
MQRIGGNLSYANVAATLALVFAMSGGAIAATGGFSSGGTLRACVNEEGVIRLLKPGKACKRGQKSVSWNQTGPAGAKGATGAAGPAGATGPGGATGATGAPASSLFAVISETGQLIRGSGVASVSGANPFIVKFSRDVSQCAFTATLNGGKADDVFTTGAIENGTAVAVFALAAGGGLEKGAPTVVATCP